MLNSLFTGFSRWGWRDTSHNIIEHASGCLCALYGGNTEAIRSHHGADTQKTYSAVSLCALKDKSPTLILRIPPAGAISMVATRQQYSQGQLSQQAARHPMVISFNLFANIASKQRGGGAERFADPPIKTQGKQRNPSDRGRGAGELSGAPPWRRPWGAATPQGTADREGARRRCWSGAPAGRRSRPRTCVAWGLLGARGQGERRRSRREPPAPRATNSPHEGGEGERRRRRSTNGARPSSTNHQQQR